MGDLVVAAVIWVGLHLVVSGTRVRDGLVRRLGERAFYWAFSLASVAAIGFLVHSWRGADTTLLWVAPGWLRWVLVVVMLVAFFFFVASVSAPNPTMVGQPSAMAEPPRGMVRVTRHPMLWSFALWAVVHMIGNGDTAAQVFFGAFLVTALAGMPSIDAKLARRDPGSWRALSAATSVVPFAAIVEGRNRFVAQEIAWWVPVVATIAWAALLYLHAGLFGVSPVVL
jgi:uncharacterized membrane protein